MKTSATKYINAKNSFDKKSKTSILELTETFIHICFYENHYYSNKFKYVGTPLLIETISNLKLTHIFQNREINAISKLTVNDFIQYSKNGIKQRGFSYDEKNLIYYILDETESKFYIKFNANDLLILTTYCINKLSESERLLNILEAYANLLKISIIQNNTIRRFVKGRNYEYQIFDYYINTRDEMILVINEHINLSDSHLDEYNYYVININDIIHIIEEDSPTKALEYYNNLSVYYNDSIYTFDIHR